jgi:hypothetical protein
MTIIRRTNNEFDNARMNAAGYEILAVEDYHWDDGHIESEILWAKDEQPIAEGEVPY